MHDLAPLDLATDRMTIHVLRRQRYTMPSMQVQRQVLVRACNVDLNQKLERTTRGLRIAYVDLREDLA